MEIQLDNLGKRYRYEWIFRGMDYRIASGGRYAVLGANGSGKSTLMRMLCGFLTPSKGRVTHILKGEKVPVDGLFPYFSLAAPYMELVEELSLREALRFHCQFKPLQTRISAAEALDVIGLPRSAREKEVRFFSSGMKQRLKIALAILSDTPLLLLDEPTTNLDTAGVDWYHAMVEKYVGPDRTVVVASNEKQDYTFCDKQIRVSDYAKKTS